MNNNEEYNKLKEMIRIFKHEIHNDIYVLKLISSKIKKNLIVENVIRDENSLPLKLRNTLIDFDMIVGRLSFLTNLLTLDANEISKESKNSSIFFDIVSPVYAFSKLYAQRRKKYIELDKNSLIELPKIYCDPFSSSMVFHIVIDNAIKYSRKDSVIFINGELYNDKCIIVITSYLLATKTDFPPYNE